MKVSFKANDTLTVEVEGDTSAELFQNLSIAQEVFDNDECGCCKCKKLKFVVREDKEENEYFELHCTNISCRARLPYGQRKTPKGSIYPKRRWDSLSEKEKESRGPEPKSGFLPDNGWYKYKPQPKTEKETK